MSGVRSVTRAAPAKINLVLELLGERSDGYTEIATIYQAVELADRVRVTAGRGPEGVTLRVTPRPPCPTERNLAWRAARLYLEHAGPAGGGVVIDLHKRIPAGAGLGGGSSDAAAVLLALDELYAGRLGRRRLAGLAASLGSDVPYFLVGGLAAGRGRGEIIEPLEDLAPIPVVLAQAGEPLSTAEVYRKAREGLTPCTDPPNIRRFLRYLEGGAGRLPPVANALEPAAMALRPGIARLVERIERLGGRAAMTGSGAAVYALFEEEGAAARAAGELRRMEPGAWVERTRTLPRSARR